MTTMLCRACGLEVVQPPGQSGRFRYCPEHRPARWAQAAWYARNRDRVRDYQRAREGRRPLEDRTCPCSCRHPACNAAFRAYASDRCPRCRRPDHRPRR